MARALVAEPRSEERDLVLAVADRERRLRRVRLVQELWRPRVGPEFERARNGAAWALVLPTPPVDRFEYALELTHADGTTEIVCDPANPLRADGPFGEKSVLELGGYRPPAWLDADPPEGSLRPVEVPTRALRASVQVAVWTPPGHRLDEPLPLLVAHDGPEYAEYSGLLRYLAAAFEAGEAPPGRAALVPPPGERNRDYSASARYARALAAELLPALEREASVPRPGAIAGVGTSLGALAMLHAHRLHPDAFGALFLQSGSYFRQRFDRHELGFPHFARIARFVGRVLAAPAWPRPVPVSLTCGTAEENLANNRAVAAALRGQGYEVELALVRDAHNWIAWRDALDPHLGALLRRAWT